MDVLWFIVVAIGPVILAAAIIYAVMRRRRLTLAERLDQKRATDELYHTRH